jgi:dTDP-glucose 4,6-dehydratase
VKGTAVTRTFDTILVTGGAGFMGSDFLRFLFRRATFPGRVINVDKLTYAADPENLAELAAEERDGRYRLEVCDVADRESLSRLFHDEKIDAVVHFAAESHVDRSIAAAEAFAGTNVLGTLTLLETALEAWGDRRDVLFHQISTDEVYGSCPGSKEFAEADPYDPSSPYAASKAGGDHMVRAFGRTHALPFTITHACNNFGPRQTPEKLIPLVIMRLLAGEKIPVYGSGYNVREWMFVEDHSRAVWDVITRAKQGRSYNVGTGERVTNLEVIGLLADEVARRAGRRPGFHEDLIAFVADRRGHDQRYALNSGRVRKELGWKPAFTLARGIAETVGWYLASAGWIERARQRLESWLAQEGDVWARDRSR